MSGAIEWALNEWASGCQQSDNAWKELADYRAAAVSMNRIHTWLGIALENHGRGDGEENWRGLIEDAYREAAEQVKL